MSTTRSLIAFLGIGIVSLVLPRFRGHQKSHASAVGVFDHGTETKDV